MRRRTLEEKLEAIRLVEEGNSARSVSDRLHIGHHQMNNEVGAAVCKEIHIDGLFYNPSSFVGSLHRGLNR